MECGGFVENDGGSFWFFSLMLLDIKKNKLSDSVAITSALSGHSFSVCNCQEGCHCSLFCGCWLQRSGSILDQFQKLLSPLVT